MKVDKFGQQVFTENELMDVVYTDPEIILKNCLVDSQISFDDLELFNKPKLILHSELDISVDEFDKTNQNVWHMPDKYKNLDIAKFVLDLCKNDAELQRAGEELLLYQERGMFPLLQYLKYLVDLMRENNIVWGVGRGSSVSSFVLYLIGIHKINSLYYDLNVEEFFK